MYLMSNLVRASSDAETDYTTFGMVEWQSQWTKHPDFTKISAEEVERRPKALQREWIIPSILFGTSK